MRRKFRRRIGRIRRIGCAGEKDRDKGENLEEEIRNVPIVFIHTMNYAQSVLYTDPDSSDLVPT